MKTLLQSFHLLSPLLLSCHLQSTPCVEGRWYYLPAHSQMSRFCIPKLALSIHLFFFAFSTVLWALCLATGKFSLIHSFIRSMAITEQHQVLDLGAESAAQSPCCPPSLDLESESEVIRSSQDDHVFERCFPSSQRCF